MHSSGLLNWRPQKVPGGITISRVVLWEHSVLFTNAGRTYTPSCQLWGIISSRPRMAAVKRLQTVCFLYLQFIKSCVTRIAQGYRCLHSQKRRSFIGENDLHFAFHTCSFTSNRAGDLRDDDAQCIVFLPGRAGNDDMCLLCEEKACQKAYCSRWSDPEVRLTARTELSTCQLYSIGREKIFSTRNTTFLLSVPISFGWSQKEELAWMSWGDDLLQTLCARENKGGYIIPSYIPACYTKPLDFGEIPTLLTMYEETTLQSIYSVPMCLELSTYSYWKDSTQFLETRDGDPGLHNLADCSSVEMQRISIKQLLILVAMLASFTLMRHRKCTLKDGKVFKESFSRGFSPPVYVYRKLPEIPRIPWAWLAVLFILNCNVSQSMACLDSSSDLSAFSCLKYNSNLSMFALKCSFGWSSKHDCIPGSLTEK